MEQLKIGNYAGRITARFIERKFEKNGSFTDDMLFFFDMNREVDFKMKTPRAWNFGMYGDEFNITKDTTNGTRWVFDLVDEINLSPLGLRIRRRDKMLSMDVNDIVLNFRDKEFAENHKEFLPQLPYQKVMDLKHKGVHI